MELKRQFHLTRQFFRRFLPLQDIPQQLFIVGAQKAGTTSLHAYLIQHQKIVEGDSKELAFFHKDAVYAKGVDYYRARFPIYVCKDCWANGTCVDCCIEPAIE